MTMRLTPGMPARWRGYVPMAPEGEGASGGTGAATTQAPAGTTTGEATTSATTTATQGETTTTTTAPTKAATASKSAEEILAAIEAERAALAAERAAFSSEVQALRTIREQDQAAERRQAVRAMGLTVPLTDAELDALVPKVDPRTDAGRVALAQFREQRGHLFTGPAPAPQVDPKKLIEDIVGGPANVGRRLFGGRAAESMIAPPRKTDWS